MDKPAIASTAQREIQSRVAFDFVRYANCWEDANILCEALRPAPGMRILSIASAGDNALALLAEGADVVAADLNAAQLACLELRRAAFRRLDYEQVLAFLGVRPSSDRPAVFARLVGDLSRAARDFWQRHPDHVAGGIIHAGKFENYFAVFRNWILPLVHSRSTIERMMAQKDVEARRAFWRETWDNRRWRLLLRVFFGRALMGRLGRDPEFFRYVEGSVADLITERVHRGLTELPTHANPFLDYIVHGNFTRALPRYLQADRFQAVRSGLDRLTLYHGSIDSAGHEHAAGGFDGFNLSDIFEYLDPETSRDLYGELVAVANRGARLAYWNTFVPRSCPTELAGRVHALDSLSRALSARDLAFFYGDFRVDEVA